MEVAGTIVASTLGNIVRNKLSSPLLKEFCLFWGVDKDLETLKSTISTVKYVLEDAGKCNTIENHVYNWLRKLKESVYDVDDLLEELYIEAQRREDNKSRGRTSRFINSFFSKSNFVKRLKLAHKIKSLNKRMDATASERHKFHLKMNAVPHSDIDIRNRETWSITDEGEIYGRDHYKEAIITRLLQDDGSENISIISIVGMGGLGKTTLARLIYNNEFFSQKENNEIESTGHIVDLKMWVYVSESFDLKSILKAMIVQEVPNSDDLESLGQKLKSNLKDKKFLLVLDDFWSEEYEEWEKLNSILKYGAIGSKIIVTTRSPRVSEMMKANPINLKGLSEDNSKELFKRRAFDDGSERGFDSRFLRIAEEIIKKCGGVPLALKALGSTMRSKKTIEEWLEVRDSEIWSLNDNGDKVIRSLKLSYMHLPPQIKDCFTYCSIFPKGKTINKLELIGQWIAHGLVALPDNMDAINLEDKGNQYFNHLVEMSFFYNVTESENGETTCTMHDLFHDLARFIVGPEFSDKVDEVITNNDCYSRYISLINCSQKVKSTIAEKVRALHIRSSNFDIVADMVLKTKNMRSLFIEDLRFDTFPKCSNLIHVRYIFINEGGFTKIPNEIGDLWSLQALHLKNCDRVTNLPESIGNLIHLRTLELSCYALKTLPKSTGQCRSLRNLIVRSSFLHFIPNSLGQLAYIRLLDFGSCEQLEIIPDGILENSDSTRSINLRKCENLREVPDSFGNPKSLESLNLSFCRKLESLPESIGNLCNLRVLDLSYCYDLKEVPLSFGNPKSLESLNLSRCRKLESLPESIGNLCNLRVLDLSDCYDLKEVPLSFGNLKSLENLDLSHCGKLESLPESIGNLCNLVTLNLSGTRIYKLPRLGEMKKLMYLHMEKLDCMPIGIGNLINLRRLDTFVVCSKWRDDCGSISELKDMKFLSKCLEINGLQNLHNPIEAEHADLKHKQRLDSLILKWSSEDMIEEPLEYDWLGVLEALQPPSSIKSLLVKGYPGLEYPDWMMLDGLNTTTFPNLTSLALSYLYWCSNLPGLVNLSHLRSLELRSIKNVTVVDGYFPSMVKLELSKMPKLEKVITMKSSQPVFPRLSKLIIDNCPSLIMQPHLPPSVVELTLLGSNNEEILARTELPVGETSQGSPSSLRVRELTIGFMESTKACSLLTQLNSLRELEFRDCELVCLPDSIRQLSFLLVLKIKRCKCLQELPDWLGELKSLQELYLDSTPLFIYSAPLDEGSYTTAVLVNLQLP